MFLPVPCAWGSRLLPQPAGGLPWTAPGGSSGSVPWNILVLLTLLTLLPAIVLSMTPFVRLLVVFHFLRQALGTQSAPTNQTLIGLSLVLTYFLMQPVGAAIHETAIVPFEQGQVDAVEAVARGAGPLRHFMLKFARQKDLALFLELAKEPGPARPEDLDMRVVVPAVHSFGAERRIPDWRRSLPAFPGGGHGGGFDHHLDWNVSAAAGGDLDSPEDHALCHGGRLELAGGITIGETCFFRNQPQLDALRNIVMARIVEARANMALRHLRIWSAGCSTGEEPYTLSMMLLEETAGKLQGWTFEILATDLNERSIAHCKRGSYGDYSTRNLTPYFRQKYFTERGDELVVNPEVKAQVNFTRVNLQDSAPMSFIEGIDVILCCNVLIYFDVTSKRRVIQHFYNSLLPRGYLFLGHSESLFGVSDDFRLVHLPAATAYIKPEKRPLPPLEVKP